MDFLDLPPHGREFLNEALQAYKNGNFTWAHARHLLDYWENEELEWFFSEVEKIRIQTYPRILKCYTPGQNFPAISVTGSDCALACEHCDKKYLHNMLQADTEEKFTEILNKFQQQGIKGALLSGGCDKNGKVPVLKYKEILDKFTDEHDFYFNAHVGLVDFAEALALKMAGITTVSFDLLLDQRVIEQVFHMNDEPVDYLVAYENLKEAKLDVVPHVLVGSNFGKTGREIDILKILGPDPPRLLVFIAMIPPKESDGTLKPPFELPSAADIAKLIFITKAMMPKTEISLGCMRPRGKDSYQIERWAIMAGANRIEIPHRSTREWAEQNGYQLEYYASCCAVLPKFEQKSRVMSISGKKMAG
jgi:uncharacterized radical SAM superfamily protein